MRSKIEQFDQRYSTPTQKSSSLSTWVYAHVRIKIVPKSLFCLYCFKYRRILLSVLRFLQAINQTKPSKDIATAIFPQISLQIVITFFSELLWSSSVLTLLLCNGELWYGGAPAVEFALHAEQGVQGELRGQQVLDGGWKLRGETVSYRTKATHVSTRYQQYCSEPWGDRVGGQFCGLINLIFKWKKSS